MKSAGCNIAEVLVQAAQAKPEAVALVAREGRFGRRWRRCTFARLAAQSYAILRRGFIGILVIPTMVALPLVVAAPHAVA